MLLNLTLGTGEALGREPQPTDSCLRYERTSGEARKKTKTKHVILWVMVSVV